MAIIPALMPVIVDTTLAAAAASVSLTVPAGYEILFLNWHDVYGDSTSTQVITLRFNGDTGANYDISPQAFGTASSTTNGATSINELGASGDTDGAQIHSNGQAVIFNRDGAEKVLIATESRVTKAGAGAEDSVGYHIEAKWRTTSGEITTVTLGLSTGNFTAGSRFILRGLRTSGAPALGSADIVQFIGSATATGASVTLPTIPAGYGMLWLFWSDIFGDNDTNDFMDMTFNSDGAGNYDHSRKPFGTTSGTTNAAAYIELAIFGDDLDDLLHSTGFVTIFNRTAQEKVAIGSHVMVEKSALAEAEDVIGYHTEGKWRNTSAEISTITLTPRSSAFTGTGKFYLFGLKIP